MVLTEKKEIRNVKYGGSVTKSEFNLIRNVAKKLKISKTELIVRSVNHYFDFVKNLNVDYYDYIKKNG